MPQAADRSNPQIDEADRLDSRQIGGPERLVLTIAPLAALLALAVFAFVLVWTLSAG